MGNAPDFHGAKTARGAKLVLPQIPPRAAFAATALAVWAKGQPIGVGSPLLYQDMKNPLSLAELSDVLWRRRPHKISRILISLGTELRALGAAKRLGDGFH